MLAFHAAFLLLVVGTTGFFLALAILDVQHADRVVRERADWLADTLGVEDPDRLLNYHRLTTAVGQLEDVVVLAAILGVLYTGALGDAIGFATTTLSNELVAGTVVLVGATLAMQVLGLPFDVFATFGVEEAFGFNRQSPALFARDAVVGASVGAVLVAILGAAVLWTIRAAPDRWWLAATGVVVAFMLVGQVILPRVVMPLFYDFEPVEAGDLRDAVEDVFERAGFACDQVYVMDASTRSSKSNAFFTGFGRTKRVVLFDTLVDRLDEAAVQSVLAHELAHWKRGHIWKHLATSAVRVAALLFVAQLLVESTWLYELFAVPRSPAAGLLLAALWLEPLDRLTRPLRNRLWIAYEREADSFARDVMGSGEPLADALAALTSENLSNPFPHPLYEAFHYTHPPVPERIRRLENGDRVEVEPAN